MPQRGENRVLVRAEEVVRDYRTGTRAVRVLNGLGLTRLAMEGWLMTDRTSPRSIRSVMRAMIVAAALSTAGCGFLAKETEEPSPVLPPPVKSEKAIYTVIRGDITEQISLRARLAPARSVDLSYPTNGRLKAVHVRAGDQVQAGQLLAELYVEEITHQLARTEIQHEQAKLALEDATYRAQFKSGPLAENEVKQRELDVQAAALELGRWQQALAESRLVAPFEGQITGIGARPGDSVTAHLPFMTLVDPRDLLVEADVDEASLPRLSIGQRARLEFSGLADAGMGVIVEMPTPTVGTAPSSTEPKRLKVRLEKTNAAAQMGMVGKVYVLLQEKREVLLLPKAALRRFGNRTYVLMQEPRREVDVVLGIEGETEVEILRGLQEGDQIIGR